MHTSTLPEIAAEIWKSVASAGTGRIWVILDPWDRDITFWMTNENVRLSSKEQTFNEAGSHYSKERLTGVRGFQWKRVSPGYDTRAFRFQVDCATGRQQPRSPFTLSVPLAGTVRSEEARMRQGVRIHAMMG